MTYSADEFLAIIHASVVRDMQMTGILASLTGAQALIESNKGNSGLTKKANNLFGIKANSTWTGPYVEMPTKENYNGKLETVNARFRAYSSWEESIHDHSKFLTENKRYANLRGVTDYKTACILIKQDGYATSATYTQTLINTIEKYNLWLWDWEALGMPGTVPSLHEVGKTYTLQSNMRVRTAPKGDILAFEDLSENAKAHATTDESGAMLLKGTRVTVKEIKSLDDGSVWIRIPSGWVCGRGSSGTIYVS